MHVFVGVICDAPPPHLHTKHLLSPAREFRQRERSTHQRACRVCTALVLLQVTQQDAAAMLRALNPRPADLMTVLAHLPNMSAAEFGLMDSADSPQEVYDYVKGRMPSTGASGSAASY